MTGCIFCDRVSLQILAENELAFAIRDKCPVRPLHTLVLPKRHEPNGLDLTNAELAAVFALSRTVRAQILEEDPNVGGFNFGLNKGVVAGQKIDHAHFHVIPRRAGEAPPPAAQP
ncbi:HIT family protein [Methylorubrum sp. Q1]|uniref:HIT family protein n=1 Tax=Methylorubrum sp. Q1 TaxID=2562453 RepID=UPI0010765BF8|nr:HIT family protein [Methylorubrum sp. Q1]TFZ58609.1 HIT family protein [Methylorubrum sp. Q1]